MKRRDINKKEYLENKRADKFLNDIKEVCKKHNMSISHEDFQGGFIITSYNDSNIKWLFDARIEYQEFKKKVKNEKQKI